MFIDLLKAIHVVNRPGCIKIVKPPSQLSFLPLNQYNSHGGGDLTHSFTHSINSY